MKKALTWILLSAFIIMYLYLGIHNWILKPGTFFDAPAYIILNSIVLIVVSFYLVQHKNDERKCKDNIEKIVDKMRDFVNSESSYKISEDTPSIEITMRNRTMSNRLEILKKFRDNLLDKNDIDYIEKQFSEYQEFIGGHITNRDYLESEDSQNELRKRLVNINDKLDAVVISLYM